MPLTEQKIRSFRPEPGKKKRLFDGRGLYLEISPTGGTYWRWKYHYGGKERRLAVGVYPDIKLKDARLLCDEARKLLSTGVDPVLQRKKDRLIQVERSGEQDNGSGASKQIERSEAHAMDKSPETASGDFHKTGPRSKYEGRERAWGVRGLFIKRRRPML
jgi:hypothetical protein